MEVKKSVEITDARIQFVSLVDKAANLKTFLITKQQDGDANFTTLGRIVKVDKESHYVTGIVYEPMEKDAHDNFMTEAEIEKAAHWYLKNGDKVDVQHSFEEANGVYVVESSVTKADCTIEDNEIKKGTWLMTIEVANDDLWSAIEKGEITGLSMGGVGKYSKEDVDIEKQEAAHQDEPNDKATDTKEGLFKRLAKMMGFHVVEKGAVTELYEKWAMSSNFWNAFYALESVLRKWDYWTEEDHYETDDATIREALSEFSEIITQLLTEKGDGIAKALHDAHVQNDSVEKAGKKMSKGNKEKLKGICQSLNEFLAEFDDEPEETQEAQEDEIDENKEDEVEMTKEDVQKMIDESITKAQAGTTAPAVEPNQPEGEMLTADNVQKMISEAIEKSLKEHDVGEKAVEKADEKANLTAEQVTKMIGDALSDALKARGVPTSVNEEPVNKGAEQHYLHGIL